MVPRGSVHVLARGAKTISRCSSLVGVVELESETELVRVVGGQVELGGEIELERRRQSVLDGSSELAVIVELGTEGDVTVGRVLSGNSESSAVSSDLR